MRTHPHCAAHFVKIRRQQALCAPKNTVDPERSPAGPAKRLSGVGFGQLLAKPELYLLLGSLIISPLNWAGAPERHPASSSEPLFSQMMMRTAAAAGAETAPALAPKQLIDLLKKGGLVAYLRHATTDTDYADQIKAEMGNCATQRTLSEVGWKQARMIGAAFAKLKIPVGDVISSQYCRAWQTADLAFGRYTQTADLNFAPAEDYTEAQLAAMRDKLMPHLSTPPKTANRVLVGHDDPFEAATGIYPEPMGVLYVIRPEGTGRFTVLGHIAPDQWTQLAP